jgi:hypothetical protein
VRKPGGDGTLPLLQRSASVYECGWIHLDVKRLPPVGDDQPRKLPKSRFLGSSTTMPSIGRGLLLASEPRARNDAECFL